MFVEECNKLGFIYKTYGIKGEFIIRTDLELSQDTIKEWESIFVEINGILVPFFIEQINKRSDIDIQIKLEDIDDEIQGKPHIGRICYIDKNILQIEDDHLFNWIDYQIINSQGVFIGKIKDILKYPGQDILKINTKEADDIIIPAIEDWIIDIDKDRRVITMELPDGLIEINHTEENIF